MVESGGGGVGSLGLLAMVGVASLLVEAEVSLRVPGRIIFPVHLHWFAVGMSISVVRVLWEDGRLRLPRWWRPAAVVAMFPLVIVALKLGYAGRITLDEEQSIIAVACGLLLCLVVLAPESALVRVLQSRPLVGLGLISYSVFLWHDPILRALRNGGITQPGRAGFVYDLTLVLALTLVASILTYYLVERPALARKRPALPQLDPREQLESLATSL